MKIGTVDGSLMYQFLDPKAKVEGFFSRTDSGSDEIIYGTFGHVKSEEDVINILNEWSHTLESIGERFPSLLDFENDLRGKVGPMSIMKPLSQRMDDIRSYYDSILLESTPISREAIDCVVAEYAGVRGIAMQSKERTVMEMKLSTNSGAPFFMKRRALIDDVPSMRFVDTPWLEIESSNPLDDGRKCYYRPAAILGWRGQEGGIDIDNVKQRVIWMFPFYLNIFESQMYNPVQRAMQRKGYIPAWVGNWAVDIAVTKMFNTKPRKDLVICTDFTKYDQHFNSDMQIAARTILSRMINHNQMTNKWFTHIFPEKFRIPLILNDHMMCFGQHGMASGSRGTNFDETLAHRALQWEVSRGSLNEFSQCNGDDGVLTYPHCAVEDVIDFYTSHGQEMNVTKQYMAIDHCVYLRRWHHQDYRDSNGVMVGVYSTYRALGRLMYQERFYNPEEWGARMVALRQLSIIENCNSHPLREEFLDFCMKRDKFRLGLDIPGFLDNIATIAEDAMAVMPDFLGYTKSQQYGLIDGTKSQNGTSNLKQGIANWWVVRALKDRR